MNISYFSQNKVLRSLVCRSAKQVPCFKVKNKSSHVEVIPSSLTQPPVPTSWESKLVAALPLPNLDICEAIQPAIPYKYIQVMKWHVNLTSQLGFILVLAWAICLRFHECSYSFNKKPMVFYTWMRKSNLHDEWLWMEICTRANILGWNPRTDGPMGKTDMVVDRIFTTTDIGHGPNNYQFRVWRHHIFAKIKQLPYFPTML